ncbi:MAG: hypothetical protein AAB363_00340 [Planctomycetota bacterium]
MRLWLPLVRRSAWYCFFGIACLPSAALGVEQIVYPSADGTIVDGGNYGPFDGAADSADWTFNASSYEGAITLSHSPLEIEQRVVWEFNLSATSAPPVTAKLTFTLRGAARFPALPAPVQVYSYPADLLENLSDFSVAPSAFVAEQPIEPYQPPTTYAVNVSSVVNEVLTTGIRRIAFRFQIGPLAQALSNQAFIDAVDSDPSTKPFITIVNRIPGDADNDRDVDLDDFAELPPCMLGPGVAVSSACRILDDDLDTDVDLADLAAFLHHLAAWGN